MITSKQNQLIKRIRSLHDKKYRDLYGEYIVEGSKLVNEANQLGANVLTVVCTEKARQLVCNLDVQVELVSEQVFEYVTTEQSPQGVLAVIKKPLTTPVLTEKSCLFLDGVSDPLNVGAIIRTAAASGYSDIYLASCADPFSYKAVRASMSGIFNVNVYQGEREELLKFIDKPVVVADMGGKNVFDLKIPNDFCLVIGSEAHGVSERIKNIAKYTVSIPMEKGIESLNASVSAGILMYALKSN